MSNSIPSVANFLDAAALVYGHPNASVDNLTQFYGSEGAPITGFNKADGFFGSVFETDSGQLIISFEGTERKNYGEHPSFNINQIAADNQIRSGVNPDCYNDALRFTKRVLGEASALGIDKSSVFLDGHSLGGAEAEYVASQTNLLGDTFGAPGIPRSDISGAVVPSNSIFNYIERGDPIGNYASQFNKDGSILQNSDIVHFGHQLYVGDPAGSSALKVASSLYDVGNNAGALGVLAFAAAQYHPLEQYATDIKGHTFGFTSS